MSQRKGRFRSRRHRQQTQNRLIGAGFLILVGVGGGLVWLFYGRGAALTAVVCLLAMAGLGGLLWLTLTLLEWWVSDEEP